MYDLLIFDLDGTLIDSANDFHKSINSLLKKYDLSPLEIEVTKSYLGNGFKDFTEKFHPNPTLEVRQRMFTEFLQEYDLNFLKTTKLYDGVSKFLGRTSKRIALCTNKPGKYALATLKHFQIDHHPWEALIYGDTFSNPKPSPDGILHILEKTKTKPNKALMIGDGVPDAMAAKNAGVDFLGVAFGYHPKEELLKLGAKSVISSFHDLEDHLLLLNR